MTAKLVCRLLDGQNHLLGWTEHHAQVKGDGCLTSAEPVVIPVDVEGVPACVSLHWADVNVETRVPCPTAFVPKGSTLLIFEAGVAMITLGQPPVGLPAVTVGQPVRVSVPVGQFGAVGLR